MDLAVATRIFTYAGAVLPDPRPGDSLEEIRSFYAIQFPELTTATISGPEVVGDQLRYKFERAVGSKG